MIARPFGLRIAAMMAALGMFFSVAAPALAVPYDANVMSEMTMPGMAMDSGCMETAQKSIPSKQMPGKSNRGSCTLCISCAVDLASVLIAAPFLWHRSDRLMGSDSNPDGVAIPPALPPPIPRA